MKTYFSKDITYSQETAPRVLSWVTPGSRVLEFGPAYGYMTRYLKETLGCRVVGIELNPDMARHVEPHAEAVIVADLENDPWENRIEGSFDFILFADVLEHLRQPDAILRKALRFGDCVLTSVPNIGYSAVLLGLLDGEFNYRELGLLDNTHVRFYTRASLHALMAACGLAWADENNLVLPQPSRTEMRKYLSAHPWALWPVIRAPDSDVYQFIQKWVIPRAGEPAPSVPPPRRASVWRALKIAVRDWRYYVADHYPGLRSAWRQVRYGAKPGETRCP